MSPRAGLQLRKQVPDVRLDGLLRQEEPFADLAVHEAVRDELEHLDLPMRRLLLERAYGRLQMDHVAAIPTATRGDLFEVTRVRQVAAENLFALSSVHGVRIDAIPRFLDRSYLDWGVWRYFATQIDA